MALKAIFNSMKSSNGYVVKDLEKYLMSLNNQENDRAVNVNSPSSAGGCIRANFYKRLGYKEDGDISPRLRRIFDNGDHMHERFQTYLRRSGLLVMEEVPLRNDGYEIQGHTDGLLQVSNNKLAVLELKSINDRGFKIVKKEGVKEKHKAQGMIYLYSLESRRKELRDKYDNLDEFLADEDGRYNYYRSLYQHLKDGKKYSREEKITFKADQHDKVDKLLFETPLPIKEVSFLYENKNDQDMKEYVLKRDDELINSLLEGYKELNGYVEKEELPPRRYKYKSKRPCKWCSFKNRCWE